MNRPAAPSFTERLVTRYYRGPEHPGRLRLIGWLRHLLHISTLRVSPHAGVVMELDETDYVQRQILLHGSYEPETLGLFERLLCDANNVCDVGAHVGLYSLVAARVLGNRGRVWAFEPIPRHVEQLIHNARLSGLDNIEIVSCAVSDHSGAARMTTEDPAALGGHFHLDFTGADRTGQPVTCTTFAELRSQFPAAGFELVKIDVEGHEAKVLASLFDSGMPYPKHLIVEYNPSFIGCDVAGGLPSFLQAHGYVVRDIHGAAFSPGQSLAEDNLWATRP